KPLGLRPGCPAVYCDLSCPRAAYLRSNAPTDDRHAARHDDRHAAIEPAFRIHFPYREYAEILSVLYNDFASALVHADRTGHVFEGIKPAGTQRTVPGASVDLRNNDLSGRAQV